MDDMINDTKILLVQEEPRGPSILIEVPVTQATQKQSLGDVQQLRSQPGQTIIIKAIRLISAKVLTNGMNIAGPNAPITELRKMALVIYSEQWQKGQLIPILLLNDIADADATTATTIPYRNRTTRFADWRNVDWAQSFIQYANGTQSAGFPYVVLLEVEYEKLNTMGVPIVGPS